MISIERKTILVSSSTAFLLAFVKFVVGFFTGSMTIIASATDSILDFFVSLANYFVLKKSEKKSDGKHNFGYGKIQGLGAFIQGSVILISGFSIIYMSVKKIINNSVMTNFDRPLYVMIFSILLTSLLVLYMTKKFRQTNNLVIKSDLFHYKTDLFTNVGIVLALVLIKFTGFVVLDLIVSIVIAGYIIRGSYKIIREGYEMLLDRSLDRKQLNQIKKILEGTSEKITNYHMLKTRKSGNNVFVEVHLVFDEKIKLFDAHEISNQVEQKIMQELPNSQVTIHLDPYNDS